MNDEDDPSTPLPPHTPQLEAQGARRCPGRDKGGNIILSRGKICDFYDPYWRVESVTETGRS